MSLPKEIATLIKRLYQELDETEKEATGGTNQIRQKLLRLPDDEVLIQLFALLNNILFFVEIYRERVQTLASFLSSDNISTQDIQETMEELGLVLGKVLEAKIRANKLKKYLED